MWIRVYPPRGSNLRHHGLHPNTIPLSQPAMCTNKPAHTNSLSPYWLGMGKAVRPHMRWWSSWSNLVSIVVATNKGAGSTPTHASEVLRLWWSALPRSGRMPKIPTVDPAAQPGVEAGAGGTGLTDPAESWPKPTRPDRQPSRSSVSRNQGPPRRNDCGSEGAACPAGGHPRRSVRP